MVTSFTGRYVATPGASPRPRYTAARARVVNPGIADCSNGPSDFQAPIANAWLLPSVWPRSELVIVNDAGHPASNPGVTQELINATDRFAAG